MLYTLSDRNRPFLRGRGAAADTLKGFARQWDTEFGSIFLRGPQLPKNNRKKSRIISMSNLSDPQILYFILYFAHTLGGPYGPPHAAPPPVQRSKGYLVGWEVRRGVLSVL